MLKFFTSFANDKSGATAIEYGIIAVMFAVTLFSVSGPAAENIGKMFTYISDSVPK